MLKNKSSLTLILLRQIRVLIGTLPLFSCQSAYELKEDVSGAIYVFWA